MGVKVLVCVQIGVTRCCCLRWPDHSFSQTTMHLLSNLLQLDDGMPPCLAICTADLSSCASFLSQDA